MRASTGPYNLAGATLLEHLFNLLNGVAHASGSHQNEKGRFAGGCEAPVCYRFLIGTAGNRL
jgi:hypothetical protein